jgi:integrase
MRLKLTKRTIDKAIAKGEEAKLWDERLPGLVLRVRAGSGKAYWGIEYRSTNDKKKRWETLGGFGEVIEVDGKPLPLTVDNARKEGARRRALDTASERERRKAAPTLKDEAERWLTEQVEPHNAERTAKLYSWMMRKHVLPALGKKSVREITRDDCQRLHNAIGKASGHRNANHALSVLGSCLGWCQVEPNPARMTRKKGGTGIRRFAEVARERVFTAVESAAIGEAIREMEKDGTLSAVDAGFFRALALTGCRPDELLSLTWGCVGDDSIDFAKQTKGGEADPRDSITITPPLEAVLSKLTRGDDDALVFPVYKQNGLFAAILRRAKVERGTGADKAVTYSFRHTFGTRGATSLPLPVLQTLMGHAQLSTTQKYIHLSRDDDPVRRAARVQAEAIAVTLDGKKAVR